MIKWTMLSTTEFEATTLKYDFSLRREGETRWVLDIFDTKISNSDDAFISSEEFKTKEEAQAYAEDL